MAQEIDAILNPAVQEWACCPTRYHYEACDRIWRLSKDGLYWWFESDGHTNYADYDPTAYGPEVTMTTPPILTTVAPAIESAFAAADVATVADTKAAQARTTAARLSEEAPSAAAAARDTAADA